MIAPAIAALQAEGIEATGPHSADAMFHPAARAGYDVAICMYHDQALIPAKTLSFSETVNVTLGLRLRPHVAGSRHRLRYRRHRQGRSRPASGRRCGWRRNSAATKTPPEDGRPAAAPRCHRPSRHQGGQRARPELPARPQRHRPDCPIGRRQLADVTVIEVGPGPGGLTRSLLAAGARKVMAIERDERCLPALEEIAAHYPGRLDVVSGDALKIDYRGLAQGPVRIVANLPYNVATPLLIGWLREEPWPPAYLSLTLMFQREVAERIVAAPGSKAYGRLAVLAGWRERRPYPVRPVAAGLHARRRRSCHRWSISYRGPIPCPAIRDVSSGSSPPPSVSGARCCGRA